jgi:hypothetical protein
MFLVPILETETGVISSFIDILSVASFSKDRREMVGSLSSLE